MRPSNIYIQLSQNVSEHFDIFCNFLLNYEKLSLLTNEVRESLLEAYVYFGDIKIQITSMSNGQLSPLVILPSELKSLLIEIELRLPTYLKMAKPVEQNLWFYYKNIQTATMVVNGTFFIVANLPLLDVTSSYEIFQAYPIVLPQPNTNLGLVYVLPFTRFAVNRRRTRYMELPDSFDLTRCTDTETSFCQITVRPLMPINRVDNVCVLSLFLNDTPSVERMCQVNVVPMSPQATGVYVAQGIWLISSAVTFDLTVNCDHTTSQVRISPPLTYVTLESGCFATSPLLDLTPYYLRKSHYDLRPVLLPPTASLNERELRLSKMFSSVNLSKLTNFDKLTEMGPQNIDNLKTPRVRKVASTQLDSSGEGGAEGISPGTNPLVVTS